MSFAVRMILAIRKNIKTIIIVVDRLSRDEKLLKSRLFDSIIVPVMFVIFYVI
jgi:hypothetical protein